MTLDGIDRFIGAALGPLEIGALVGGSIYDLRDYLLNGWDPEELVLWLARIVMERLDSTPPSTTAGEIDG